MENKIHIIIHPINWELVYEWEPQMGRLSKETARKIFEWVQPFHISSISGICSRATGHTISADLILCPLTMEQMTGLHQNKVYNTVLRCARLAKRQNAHITALVAYTAMVGGRGEKIQQAVNLPLTTGLNLSCAVLGRAILKAQDILGHEAGKSTVTIMGTNSLSAIVLFVLAQRARKFYIYSTHKNNERFLAVLPDDIKRKIIFCSTDLPDALGASQVVVNAMGVLPQEFDEKYLQPGAIVADGSYPRIVEISRPDVLLMDGAAMAMPGETTCGFNYGLPQGHCYPCMAEAMVLAFENKPESYTIGHQIFPDKAEAIYKAAMKHGFGLGPLTSREIVISDEKIETVRNAVGLREKSNRVLLDDVDVNIFTR